jgi:hypothetical protein
MNIRRLSRLSEVIDRLSPDPGDKILGKGHSNRLFPCEIPKNSHLCQIRHETGNKPWPTRMNVVNTNVKVIVFFETWKSVGRELDVAFKQG